MGHHGARCTTAGFAHHCRPRRGTDGRRPDGRQVCRGGARRRELGPVAHRVGLLVESGLIVAARQ